MGCLELRATFHVALSWLFPAIVGSGSPWQDSREPLGAGQVELDPGVVTRPVL